MARKLNIDWDKAIQEYKESGKSITRFCKERGFSTNTFYLNRQKLKKKGFVKIDSASTDQRQLKHEQGKIIVADQSTTVQTSSIKIEYKGITISLEEGFSSGFLQKILSALGIEK